MMTAPSCLGSSRLGGGGEATMCVWVGGGQTTKIDSLLSEDSRKKKAA